MSDTYQAVYDAVRSKLGNCDVGAAVNEAIAQQAQGLSWAIESVKEEHLRSTYMQQAPHVLMRPSISIDGNQWCALYGENLQDGVAGFGDSPALAMHAFDLQWGKSLKPLPPPTEQNK